MKIICGWALENQLNRTKLNYLVHSGLIIFGRLNFIEGGKFISVSINGVSPLYVPELLSIELQRTHFIEILV